KNSVVIDAYESLCSVAGLFQILYGSATPYFSSQGSPFSAMGCKYAYCMHWHLYSAFVSETLEFFSLEQYARIGFPGGCACGALPPERSRARTTPRRSRTALEPRARLRSRGSATAADREADPAVHPRRGLHNRLGKSQLDRIAVERCGSGATLS